MSGLLLHPVAKVIIALLKDQGLVSMPQDNAAWPCYFGDEPDSPDNCLTVFDTDGKMQGREHITGEVQESNGFQVRVRCDPTQLTEGYAKLKSICQFFDLQVLRTLVPMGDHTYRIQAINRTSDVLSLGRESTTSKRRVYVVNAMVSLRLLPGTGSY